VPGHIETISRYANFERRQQPNDLSVALNILNEGLNSETVDVKVKAFLAVQVAKLLWHVCVYCYGCQRGLISLTLSWFKKGMKSVHEARQVFLEGSTKYLDSKYFWLNYVSFELAQNGQYSLN
jgi:pre-mRNA-processing factor 39